MPYDQNSAFAGVGLLVSSPLFMLVPRNSPVKSVAEYVELAKRPRSKLDYANAGVGATSHLATEMFLQSSGIEVNEVGYRGGGPAIQAVLAGEAGMLFMPAAAVMSFIQSGDLRPLAATTRERSPLAPEVPTFQELGHPGFEVVEHVAMLAPAGTPEPILRKLNEACVAVLRAPDMQPKLQAMAVAPEVQSLEAWPAYFRAESDKWRDFVRPQHPRAVAMVGRRALLAATTTAGAPALARAQAAARWPDRPVRVVVPFTPEGTTDILARALGAELQEALGQPVVVENRGSAGGTLGTEAAARAAPDGHTLLMGHIGTLAVNPALYPNLPFDTAAAFEPVVLVAVVPNVLAANPRTVKARNVPELVALARRRPRGLSYGSGGNGSAAHITMVAFTRATGTEMEHIPYRGTGPMMSDLIAGTIGLTLTGGPPALPPVRAGTLRALGVSSLRRLASAPDIPTIAEQGVPGFEVTQWYGLAAPAGTPRPIVERLNAECARILRGEKLRPRLAAEGAKAEPGTPERFRDFIAAERACWGELVRLANMRPD